MGQLQAGSRVATRLACYRMGNRPRTKNGRKLAGEMASSHFWGGPEPKMAEKRPGNGRFCIKSPNFSCPSIRPAIFRPFWNPPKKQLPASSPGIVRPFFGFGPVSHSAAGQSSRNSRAYQKHARAFMRTLANFGELTTSC